MSAWIETGHKRSSGRRAEPTTEDRLRSTEHDVDLLFNLAHRHRWSIIRLWICLAISFTGAAILLGRGVL